MNWHRKLSNLTTTLSRVTTDIKVALYDAFLEADRMMRPKVEAMDDFSGSTAVVAVVTPTHVVVANSGDSRAVVGTGKVGSSGFNFPSRLTHCCWSSP